MGEEIPPLSFPEVQAAYDYAKGQFPDTVGPMSLSAFSRYMNEQTGSAKYAAGDVGTLGKLAKQYSYGLEDVLSPIKETFGELGGGIGRKIGPVAEKVGTEFGQALPRLGLQIGAMASKYGLPLGLADAYTQGYAETGSPLVGAISAGTLAAAPYAGRAGQRLATKYVGEPIAKAVGGGFGDLLGKGVGYGGAQTGMAATMEGGGQFSSLVQGQGFRNPLEPHNLGHTVAGLATFGLVDALKAGSRAVRGRTDPPAVSPANSSPRVPPLSSQPPPLDTAPTVAVQQAEKAAGTVARRDPSVAEVVQTPQGPVEQFALPGTEAIPPVSWIEVANQALTPGVLPGQLWNKIPVEMRKDIPGVTTPDKLRYLRSSIIDPWRRSKGYASMFTTGQLQADLFGTVATEQMNLPKPFGLEVAKDGTVPTQNVMARLAKTISKDEMAVYEANGLKEFLKGPRVSTASLKQFLEQKGPKLEVVKQDFAPQASPEEMELQALQHLFDSSEPATRRALEFDYRRTRGIEAGPSSDEVAQVIASLSTESRQRYARYRDLSVTVSRRQSSDIPTYPQIAPKSQADLAVGDAVLGLVRVPVPSLNTSNEVGLKYKGPHFGQADKNVVAFFRGVFETLPTGEKVFHVFELQSDWAQKARTAENDIRPPGGIDLNDGISIVKDPLLPHYQRLGLKAAIKHAIEKGAKYIALSDAETAMMTEGHDRSAEYGGRYTFTNPKTGESRVIEYHGDGEADRLRRLEVDKLMQAGWTFVRHKEIPQEPGMRLNYDEVGPKIVGDLTGEEPIRVSFGPHEQALNKLPEGHFLDQQGQPIPRADLIFKNPDGTPKTDSSARMYSLDKVKEELVRRGGFTFFGRDKIVTALRELEANGADQTQLAAAQERLESLVIRPGERLEDAVARELGLDPIINEPAQLLAQTRPFFQRLFSLQGHSPDRASGLAELAESLAKRFAHVAGNVRLVEAVGPANFALSPRGDRWNAVVGVLRNQGLPTRDIDSFGALWAFGHEMTHQLEFGVKGEFAGDLKTIEAYKNLTQLVAEMPVPERMETMRRMFEWWLPKGQRMPVETRPYDNPAEFIADFVGLTAMGTNSKRGEVFRDLLFFGDRPVSRFMAEVARTVAQVWDGVKRWLGIAVPKERSVVDKHTESLTREAQRLLATDQQVRAAETAFLAHAERFEAKPWSDPPSASVAQIRQFHNTLAKLDPSLLDVHPQGREMEDFANTFVAEAEPWVKPNAWPERFSALDYLKPLSQLAKSWGKIPSIAKTVDILHSYLGMSSRALQEMWERINPDVKYARKLVERVGKDGSLVNQITSNIMRRQNEESRTYVTEADIVRFEPKFASLKPEQKRDVLEFVQAGGRAAVQGALIRVNDYRSKIETQVTRTLQIWNPTIQPEAAEGLAAKIVSFTFDKNQPPEVMARLDAEISGAGATGTAAVDKAYKLAESSLPALLKVKERLLGPDGQGKPWYSPEVRLGEYQIAYKTSDGKPGFESFKNLPDAEKRFESLSKRSDLAYLRKYLKSDSEGKFSGLSPDLIDSYRDADNQLYQQVLKSLEGSGADPETLKSIAEEFQPGAGAYAEIAAPYMRDRHLVEGRQALNMVEGMIRYMSATAYGTAKAFARNKGRVYLHAPDLRANPSLQTALRRTMSSVLDPQGKEWTTLKNLVFFNFMGLNPSYFLIEPTQQVVSHVPFLVREGATIGEGMRFMLSAVKENGASYLNKGSYRDVEIDGLIKRARKDRVINTGIVSELSTQADLDFAANASMFTSTSKVAQARDLITNGAYRFLKFARDAYATMPVFNEEVALISSYRMARSRGKTAAQAEEFARVATRTTMYGGGIANRPMAFLGWGKMSGVAGVMYALNSYTFNTMAMTGRLAREAIDRTLPVAERSAARKAVGLQMGVMFALGGTLGLPLVAAGIGLVEQLFPEAQVKKNLRKAFFDLAGDDENLGHFIADGAMSGVANVGPIDFGSRFQLGNLLGVSAYDGFTWKNLAGPAASTLESFVKAGQAAIHGDTDKAVEHLAPSGLRNLVRLVNDGGVVRDAQDRMLFEPTNVEKGFLMAGFKPKRLTQHYEAESIRLRGELVASEELQRFHSDLAKRLVAGQHEVVKDALNERLRSSPPGTYDVQQSLRRVVEIAQSMTVPYDSSRSGPKSTIAERDQLSRLYGTRDRQSEQGLLAQRQGLASSLGSRQRPDREGLRRAVMVDSLMALNPTLSYGQAQVMVERAMNPRSFARSTTPLR